LTAVGLTLTSDLSNLCIEEGEPDERLVAYCSPPQQGDLKQETSLYPTQRELHESTHQDFSVEEIFAQSESYRRTTKESQVQVQVQSSCDSTRPRAYRRTSHGHIEKPELPAWVEATHSIREKVQRQGFQSEMQHEASRRDMVAQQQPQPMVRINDPPPCSFGPTNDTFYSETGEPSPNYRRPRPSAQPVEVEVAPGEYMTLRGSEETLHAIELGRARLVTCFVCTASLACVPDCELVICPDCRVISPVPTSEDDSYTYYRGVGLGLKMG
jgi:hypothetical protein